MCVGLGRRVWRMIGGCGRRADGGCCVQLSLLIFVTRLCTEYVPRVLLYNSGLCREANGRQLHYVDVWIEFAVFAKQGL